MPDTNKNVQKDVLIDDERLVHAGPEEDFEEDPLRTKEQEQIDDEVQKELKKRVDAVEKDINNAETPKPEATNGEGKKTSVEGLTKEPRRLKEKLILEEPADILTEDLDKSLSKEEAIKAINEGLNLRISVGNKSVKLNNRNAKNLLSIADKIYLAEK